jgi:hypothetical protein
MVYLGIFLRINFHPDNPIPRFIPEQPSTNILGWHGINGYPTGIHGYIGLVRFMRRLTMLEWAGVQLLADWETNTSRLDAKP